MKTDFRRAFLQRFLSDLRSYHPAAVFDHAIANKLFVFSWKHPAALLFVGVTTADHDDAFTLDVAWSRTGQYPARSSQRTSALYDLPSQGIRMQSAVGGGLVFRIGDIFEPPHDVWWDLRRGCEFRRGARFLTPASRLNPRTGGAAIGLALHLLEARALPYVIARIQHRPVPAPAP